MVIRLDRSDVQWNLYTTHNLNVQWKMVIWMQLVCNSWILSSCTIWPMTGMLCHYYNLYSTGHSCIGLFVCPWHIMSWQSLCWYKFVDSWQYIIECSLFKNSISLIFTWRLVVTFHLDTHSLKCQWFNDYCIKPQPFYKTLKCYWILISFHASLITVWPITQQKYVYIGLSVCHARYI